MKSKIHLKKKTLKVFKAPTVIANLRVSGNHIKQQRLSLAERNRKQRQRKDDS